MANMDDIESPTGVDDVWRAILSERHYQLYRWGVRQPRESGGDYFAEPNHSDADWAVYIQDYLGEVIANAARTPGTDKVVASLRKIAAMALHRFQRLGIAESHVRQEVAMRMPHPADGVSASILRIQTYVAMMPSFYADPQVFGGLLYDVIAQCIACFTKYGCPVREILNITNGRDNQPAGPQGEKGKKSGVENESAGSNRSGGDAPKGNKVNR